MSRLRPRFATGRIATRVWGALAVALAVGAMVSAPQPFERLAVEVFDSFQRLRPRPPGGAPVVIVDVDEGSIARIGQWPWPRRLLATLTDRLGELGAGAIAFDMVFSEADRLSLDESARAIREAGGRVELPDRPAGEDGDAALAGAMARNPTVAGQILTNAGAGRTPPAKSAPAFIGPDPTAYIPDQPAAVTNLPELTEAATGLGVFSLRPGLDGVIRSVPLVARSGTVLLPSLAVEALRIAQGGPAVVIRSAGGEDGAAMTDLKVGDFQLPTNADGSVSVYFSGLPTIQVVPAADILAEGWRGLQERIAGHIVLIGTSAPGLYDLRLTPLGDGVPGVSIHAEVIDSIMAGTVLSRPDWAPGLELAAAVAAGAVLVIALPYLGPLVGTGLALALIVAAFGGAWAAFTQELVLIDPVRPALATLMALGGALAGGLLASDRERRFIRKAFSQYLAPELVQRLAETPGQLRLGGETRELTVLFTDIRGFSRLSEGMEPTELTALLNGVLTPMTDELLRAGAVIDKYMGDAIMAFWNAPLPVPDHARRACLCALAMQRALTEFGRADGRMLKMGIGLHTGPCCVGNLGSKQRFSYSAIGDTVNLASRIEGLTKQLGVDILVSADVAAQAGDLAVIEVDLVRVVGRREPVTVFALLGKDGRSEQFVALRAAMNGLLADYRERNWTGASDRLSEALAAGMPAGLADVFTTRLALLRETPPAEGWDGVFEAGEK